MVRYFGKKFFSSAFLGSLSVLSPAKINLFLSVEDKRSDGYHNICTVLCPVSLYDVLVFNFLEENVVSVGCSHPDVLSDEQNLVGKAINLFLRELARVGVRVNCGFSVEIKKKIPVGAGFGGGSSNAAAALSLLNRVFGHPFSTRKLISIGERIGADVPFFIFGKPAVATGIGNCLDIFPCIFPDFALLVYPGLLISTSWVYNNLHLKRNLRLTKNKKKLSKSHLDVGSFHCGCSMFNELESVTEKRFPIISDIKSKLLGLGAVGALMSGSGSGVFGLFTDFKKARMAKRNLVRCAQDGDWSVYMVRLLTGQSL